MAGKIQQLSESIPIELVLTELWIPAGRCGSWWRDGRLTGRLVGMGIHEYDKDVHRTYLAESFCRLTATIRLERRSQGDLETYRC